MRAYSPINIRLYKPSHRVATADVKEANSPDPPPSSFGVSRALPMILFARLVRVSRFEAVEWAWSGSGVGEAVVLDMFDGDLQVRVDALVEWVEELVS